MRHGIHHGAGVQQFTRSVFVPPPRSIMQISVAVSIRSKWSKLFLRTTRYRVSLRLFGLPLLSYSWQHGEKSISILGIPVHTRTCIKPD